MWDSLSDEAGVIAHRDVEGNKKVRWCKAVPLICIILVLIMLQTLTAELCSAGLIDRVVAYVDNNAITYSEFREKLSKLREVFPGISEEEAVNSMINTLLLLDQAHKMRLEAASDDDLVKEYIDIRIKSRVFIKEDELTAYFNKHKREFGSRDYISVRDEIEKYLSESEINRQLKKHIEDLKRQSNIVIRLRDI